jgi:putative restriction endonuclease
LRYWWVNQNQTYRQEIGGGYLWSPKLKSNQQRNPFYEFMREVAPGDVVFSFCDTRICALGIASSYCYESPKPTEFGTAGANWEAIGWKVDVSFRELENRIRPKDHMDQLRSRLPARYAPLRPNGDGLQSIYLAEVTDAFAAVLFTLIGAESNQVRETATYLENANDSGPAANPTLEEWERRVEVAITTDPQIGDTDRAALVLARRGQGLFRANVRRIEHACRVTKVERPEHLVASHTKPWRDSTNEERLDGENGFMLTPTVDHLFDKGFISFENNGDLIVSPVAHAPALIRMGIAVGERTNVGAFSAGQRGFLEYHRENVLRLAKVKHA